VEQRVLVVATNAEFAVGAYERHAFGRLRAIADHVAKAEDGVDIPHLAVT
jgi:hypothetical protein